VRNRIQNAADVYDVSLLLAFLHEAALRVYDCNSRILTFTFAPYVPDLHQGIIDR